MSYQTELEIRAAKDAEVAAFDLTKIQKLSDIQGSSRQVEMRIKSRAIKELGPHKWQEIVSNSSTRKSQHSARNHSVPLENAPVQHCELEASAQCASTVERNLYP